MNNNTPANDEREALIDVLVMTKLSDYAATDMSTIHQAVDAILAAGFRRSEVQGELSNAQVAQYLLDHGHYVPDELRAALRAAGRVR